MNNDKVKNHINELNNKHHALDMQLHEMIKANHPDDKIAKIKKEKLKIKDEIAALEHTIHE